MPILGTAARIKMRSGIAHASSRGNFGTRPTAKVNCCGAYKASGAARAGNGCGKMPRSTTVYPFSRFGANIERPLGRSCWDTGVYQTFRSLIATFMSLNARLRHAIEVMAQVRNPPARAPTGSRARAPRICRNMSLALTVKLRTSVSRPFLGSVKIGPSFFQSRRLQNLPRACNHFPAVAGYTSKLQSCASNYLLSELTTH